MPQLKWLLEMTPSSTITIHPAAQNSGLDTSSSPPPMPLHDLAYVRRRLPRHAVFYDLSPADRLEFSSMKDSVVTDGHQRDVVQIEELRSFSADQWKVCCWKSLPYLYPAM